MKNTDILSISKLNNVVSPCKHESTILTRNSTFTYLNYIYHVLICVPNMIKNQYSKQNVPLWYFNPATTKQ